MYLYLILLLPNSIVLIHTNFLIFLNQCFSLFVCEIVKILFRIHYCLHVIYLPLLLEVFHFTIYYIMIVEIKDTCVCINQGFVVEMLVFIIIKYIYSWRFFIWESFSLNNRNIVKLIGYLLYLLFGCIIIVYNILNIVLLCLLLGLLLYIFKSLNIAAH